MIPLKDIARLVSTHGLLATSALYAVGILIVNIDLATYGVSNLELVRSEYVLSGALWSVLATVTVLTYHGIRTRAGEATSWLRYVLSLLLEIAAYWGALGILLLFVSGGSVTLVPVEAISGKSLFVLGVLLFCLLINIRILQGLEYVFRILLKDWRFTTIQSIGFLLAGLTAYSIVVYPRLSKEFGGGRNDLLPDFAPVRQ